MISSEDADQETEVSRCKDEDLTHSFEVVLKDLPEVLMYIKRLNEHILKQQKTLVKLYEKLKEYKQLSTSITKRNGSNVRDACSQTEPFMREVDGSGSALDPKLEENTKDQSYEWSSASGGISGGSLADEVKKVAESAMQQTGFVYEETSGMYYDYNTGYYYNAEMGLYYDGHSGTYLYYNEGTKSYEYHSQAATLASHTPSDQVMLEGVLPKTFTSIPFKVSEDLVEDVKMKLKHISTAKPDPFETVKKRATMTKVDLLETRRKKASDKSDPLETKVKKEPATKHNSSETKRKKAVAAKRVSARTKSKKVPATTPDPLEAKENDLDTPGSNPMAPVLFESSNVPSCHESRLSKKSSKESKSDHKRKGKHKKHKSKKKKKKRHHSISKSENSLEEGECSESSGSEIERDDDRCLLKSDSEKWEEKMDIEEIPAATETCVELSLNSKVSQPWKNFRRLSEEASEAWPPCMRIIVQSTEVKNLSVGTLFIVTCKGGTLGREKSHSVTIPDINISKHHGVFTFDESNGGNYFFTDYGSRNGTYVNKQRLSSAKQESEPCEISHGTIITLGSTELLCHIHPGTETCEECEPGVVAARKAEDYELPQPNSHAGESKSEKRLQELRRLRKRFGLEGNETKGELAPGYEDRAEIRRVTVGSHNEHAKTEVASTTESIRSTNKGFKMLAKMGWKEGESLGKDGTGLTEPVLVSQRADKVGLGADSSFSAAPGMDSKSKVRADKWTRARERYGQLPDTMEGQ